jgi:signal transduction histidine kinase
LRQFLDLGKPPTNVQKPCDVVQLIGQTIAFLKPQSQHAGTALTWNPPGMPRIVLGDATQLSHLFGNVVGNAVEAAGPGGTVEVRFQESETQNGQRMIVIEISDSGPGPPPTIALRLFEPFVTGKDQGVGLGLAVAKQVADAHGGRIGWERRSGRTVFRIELPEREEK